MERISSFTRKFLCGIACISSFWLFLSIPVSAAVQSPQFLKLNTGWQYHIDETHRNIQNNNSPWKFKGWKEIPNVNTPKSMPKRTISVWYRIKLPKCHWLSPCIYFEKIDARSFVIYLDNLKVYEKNRDRTRYDNKVIIPLNSNFQGKTLLLRVYSKKLQSNFFGPVQTVFLGNHGDLLVKYCQNGFVNIILGFSLALTAMITIFCSFFLKNNLKKSWIALCMVTFISGLGIAIYPNNLSSFFPFLDKYSTVIIDVLTFTMLPILTYFFAQLFGSEHNVWINRLWKTQIVFSGFTFGLLLFNFSPFIQIKQLYTFVANEITGFFYITQYFALMGVSIFFTLKGDIDAKIFTAGFLTFSLVSIYDIIISFSSNLNNRFTLWKWGLVVFITSLYMILGRKIIANYYQVVTYSAELELKNKELDDMWHEVKISRDQLANLNVTLEERVIERTHQLEVANLELSSVNEELSKTNLELIHTMEILKKTQNQLIESEKLAALGHLIAGITHEINTPFGAIRASIGNITESLSHILNRFLPFFQQLAPDIQCSFLTLLRDSLAGEPEKMTSREERQLRKTLLQQFQKHNYDHSEEYADSLAIAGITNIEPYFSLLKHRESDFLIKMVYTFSGLQRNLKTITVAAERTAKVIFALKSYTHQSQSNKMIKSDIIQGIETVLTLYQNKIKNNVKVEFQYQEVPFIWCFPDELNQVWTNIIDNALYAMNYHGLLNIKVSKSDEYIIVNITDNGPGIPETVVDKIFNPFFTTKPPGEGSGMGLDIVKKIIEKHNGKIEYNSIPGKTRFSFYIPFNQV